MRAALVVLAALAVGAAGVLLLSGVLSDRDGAGTRAPAVPGVAAPTPVALAPDLRRGNVVLAYRDPADARAAAAAAAVMGGRPTPALRAAGQAVLARRGAGPARYTALAWQRAQGAAALTDPDLRAFVQYWLGRGGG